MMKKILYSLIFLTCLFGLGVSFPTAQAQSPRDYYGLEDRIKDLEKEIRVLQRTAAQGRLSARRSGTGEEVGVRPEQRGLLADMEVRISQLEAELRRLTGQIEELVHRQDVLEDQVRRFREDVEFRFQQGRSPSSGTANERERPADTPPGLVPTETQEEAEAVLQESGVRSVEVLEPDISLPEGSVQDRYDYAFSFLRRGDYPSAEAAFKVFLEAHPDHELAGNAQYWLGETYYVRQDLPQAAEAFLKGFQEYGESSKGPDNLLKLGMTLGAMGETEQACSAFSELDSRYPEASESIRTRVQDQEEQLGCQ